jgi:SAM-dependent methyltransferase
MGEVKLQSEVTDKYGFSTLDTIASADKFNRWMYDVIAPYCNGDILEIGGGIGNISMQLLLDNKSLTVTELHEEYCEIIRKRLTGYKGLRQVVQMDITDKNFDGKYQEFFNRFDSVFALNVIEHIDERDLALQNCRKLLKPGGNLIILVPAFQSLYNQFDQALGHFLRFRMKSLCQLMSDNGYQVIHKQYFNFIGIFGWWFTGSILKKKEIPEGQMSLYNFFVPIFRIVDVFTKRFAGLSVIAIGKKNT